MQEVKVNKRMRCGMRRILYGFLYMPLILSGLMMEGCVLSPDKIILAKDGNAKIAIALPSNADITEQFAAAELSKYLQKISGASFIIDSGTGIGNEKIQLAISDDLPTEDYVIAVQDHHLILKGGSGHALLYAVYDFLGRLGCLWIAPDFSFYNGHGEYIPHKENLFFTIKDSVYEHPAFAYRKLDVEEGRSHNAKNLKQIIDWMPKLRYNILMIPLDYGGSGRVQWDKWRDELTPELKKRGLMTEVGGHGYQNFLNAGMPAIKGEGSGKTLFEQHPDWFGKDKNCKPSPAEHIVFNTSNPGALKYFIANILEYLGQHPEINIFDLWPPDGARWAECPSFSTLGSFQDRQAQLANRVDSAIKTIRPDLQLEIIAYARALLPPEKTGLHKDILVDFCPINQSFEKQINDSSAGNNVNYVNAIHAWRKKFAGNIGLYSYYRKYAWRSLPNIIPHYMQQDMQWYAKVPLQGISIYSEPGDWGTYELNYYTLGHLAWDPGCNINELIDQFGRARYDLDWKVIKKTYSSLERIIRLYGSIPYTQLKPADRIMQAEKELTERISSVNALLENSSDTMLSANLSRLLLMLRYADFDLKIQQSVSSKKDPAGIRKQVSELVSFLEKNRDKGVFVLPDKNNKARYMRHYGVELTR